MYILATIFFFIFGAIIGSFLNVVILRYNTGGALGGRSGCMSCGKQLVWYELFPIVSFLFLKGRCSRCKSKISWQYPLVEGLTGILFAAVFLTFFKQGTPFDIFQTIYYLFLMAILVVIAVYDIRHTIIPDGFVYTFIVASFVHLLFIYPPVLLIHFPYLLDLLAGPLLFVSFYLLWLVSKGTWMGFGDAKLVLGIGLALGFSDGISAVVFAFWIGAIISIIYLILGKLLKSNAVHKVYLPSHLKHLTIKSEIPFAPYLILGMLIVLFFDISLPGLRFLVGL